MKKKVVNPLDELIIKFTEEFSKIPNYERDMQDPELRRVHTFIAVSISGIQASRNLVIGSFIPAANKAIYETKNQIRASAFKHLLNTMDYDVESIKEETIRLGYVFTFHKFEVFIKELIALLDGMSDSEVMPLEKYGKKVFNFQPTQWFKNPTIHLINFISNCTKHQDGLCRLDNPSHSVPNEFLFHPTDQKIKRTQQQYRKDIDMLIEITPLLTKIISGIVIYRELERSITYEDSYIDSNGDKKVYYKMDEETKQFVDAKKKIVFDSITQMIQSYKTRNESSS